MKKRICSLLIAFPALTFAQESASGFHTMVTDCKDFSIVNVLPTWKYYDSGVNAYITTLPANELPLIHLDSSTSRSFEEGYEVSFSNDQMIVRMSRFDSNVVLVIKTDAVREGRFSSTAVVGNLDDNFKEMFGQFAHQTFSCESKITKDE